MYRLSAKYQSGFCCAQHAEQGAGSHRGRHILQPRASQVANLLELGERCRDMHVPSRQDLFAGFSTSCSPRHPCFAMCQLRNVSQVRRALRQRERLRRQCLLTQPAGSSTLRWRVRRVVSKDIKGVRSRHGAIASSTQLQHLHEEVTRVQVRADRAIRRQHRSVYTFPSTQTAELISLEVLTPFDCGRKARRGTCFGRCPDFLGSGVQTLLQKLQVEQRLMKRRLERQHASSVRPASLPSLCCWSRNCSPLGIRQYITDQSVFQKLAVFSHLDPQLSFSRLDPQLYRVPLRRRC